MARPTHLHGLDILRITAAAMVMLNHFALFGWRDANGLAYGADAAFPMIEIFSGTGAVGVKIFFVISGFVIAMSAANAGAWGFLRNRIIRIGPALWICASIALIARALYGDPLEVLIVDYARSIILSPKGPYIDGVIWTLVVEAVFYLLICGAILLRPRISLEHLALGLGVVSCLFLLGFAVANMVALQGGSTAVYDLMRGYVFKVTLLRHGVFFAIGMLFFSIYRSGVRPWHRGVLPLFFLFGMIEISLSAMTAPGAPSALACSAVWGAGMVGIVASIRWAPGIANLLGRRTGLTRNLGCLSYPLYLNHYALGMVLTPALFAAGLGPHLALATLLVIILGTSWLIAQGPEISWQNLLKKQLWAAPPDITVRREQKT
ncbi:MAG: acyltransferase family protein [Sulfitobacter sp.]